MPRTFRRIHIGVIVLLSSFVLCSLAVNEDECTDMCSQSSTSNITLSEITISNATVTWSESFGTEDPFFIVKHREHNSGVFESSEVMSGTMYTIQGLNSVTNYEVQVCLANTTYDCGGCLKCFTTSMHTGLPSVPKNVMVTSSGPRMITVVWDTPDFIGGVLEDYTVYFGTNQSNFIRNVDARRVTISTDILPDTTYFVTVSARGLLGDGEESEPVTITTDQLSTVPGIFLVALQDQLIYYSAVDETFFNNNFQIGNQMNLADLSTPIIDISYDYRRGYIYVSTTNNSIIRYNVTIGEEGNNLLTLTQTGSEELYSDLDGVGSISVDWVNDRIFWVEHVDNTSQIRSGPLNGGTTMTHGTPLSGLLNSLTVDPIQGYFYWVIEGSLLKLNYSEVINAGKMTNLTPFQFTIDSATSFTLDLTDSQYYYMSDERTTVRRGLGDNFISESGALGVVPTLRTSFGERVVLTLTAAPSS